MVINPGAASNHDHQNDDDQISDNDSDDDNDDGDVSASEICAEKDGVGSISCSRG